MILGPASVLTRAEPANSTGSNPKIRIAAARARTIAVSRFTDSFEALRFGKRVRIVRKAAYARRK